MNNGHSEFEKAIREKICKNFMCRRYITCNECTCGYSASCPLLYEKYACKFCAYSSCIFKYTGCNYPYIVD